MGTAAKHPIEQKPRVRESQRPNLRVIPGDPDLGPTPEPAPPEDHGFSPTFFLLLVAVIGAASGSIAFFAWQQSLGPHGAMDQYSTLARDYRLFGLDRFLESKQKLKDQVSRSLRDEPKSPAGREAEQIAVFLFPELLDDENFEKAEALETWAPLERAIEHAPRTPEARQWLADLRAALWNYDSPSRVDPRLSPYAAQALRIYEALGVP